MHFTDSAIIVARQNLQEKSGYITVLTKEHGLYKGFVQSLNGKNAYIYQSGNIIKFDWQARLENHMGKAKCELISSISHILNNKKKLYALNSLLALISFGFKERIKYEHCFETLKSYITDIDSKFSFKRYIEIEFSILEELGYGIDLSACAVTGTTKDLAYVSPKTGRAVSFDIGQKYKDKLLRLPQFILDNKEPSSVMEIEDAAALLNYFFKRYILIDRDLDVRSFFIRECIKSISVQKN